MKIFKKTLQLLTLLLTLPLISKAQTLEWSIGSEMAAELEGGGYNGDFESVNTDQVVIKWNPN